MKKRKVQALLLLAFALFLLAGILILPLRQVQKQQNESVADKIEQTDFVQENINKTMRANPFALAMWRHKQRILLVGEQSYPQTKTVDSGQEIADKIQAAYSQIENESLLPWLKSLTVDKVSVDNTWFDCDAYWLSANTTFAGGDSMTSTVSAVWEPETDKLIYLNLEGIPGASKEQSLAQKSAICEKALVQYLDLLDLEIKGFEKLERNSYIDRVLDSSTGSAFFYSRELELLAFASIRTYFYEEDSEENRAGFSIGICSLEEDEVQKLMRQSSAVPNGQGEALQNWQPTFAPAESEYEIGGFGNQVSTPAGVYRQEMLPGYTGNILYYYDKATAARAPICRRKDCEHCDESCEAYNLGVMAIQGDTIYFKKRNELEPPSEENNWEGVYEIELTACSLDLSEKTVIFRQKESSLGKKTPNGSVSLSQIFLLQNQKIMLVLSDGIRTTNMIEVDAKTGEYRETKNPVLAVDPDKKRHTDLADCIGNRFYIISSQNYEDGKPYLVSLDGQWTAQMPQPYTEQEYRCTVKTSEGVYYLKDLGDFQVRLDWLDPEDGQVRELCTFKAEYTPDIDIELNGKPWGEYYLTTDALGNAVIQACNQAAWFYPGQISGKEPIRYELHSSLNGETSPALKTVASMGDTLLVIPTNQVYSRFSLDYYARPELEEAYQNQYALLKADDYYNNQPLYNMVKEASF